MDLQGQKRPDIEYDLGDRIVLRFNIGRRDFGQGLTLARRVMKASMIQRPEVDFEICIGK